MCERGEWEASTIPPDLRRARYVIEHYAHLQGLRLIPLGACFFGSAAWRAGFLAWLPGIDGSGARWWFFSSVGIALVASIPIGAAYRRRIGIAIPQPTATGAVTLASSFVAFVVLALLPANGREKSMAVLFVALALGYLGCVEHGLRRHYLAVAAGCLVFAIAPRLGVPGEARSVALDLLIGMGLVVAGVGDHLVLQRVLNPPKGSCDVRAA